MSEITISLEQVEAYIKTLSGEYDEWWMPEYDLCTTGIIEFFKTVDEGFSSKIKIAVQEHSVIADRLEAEKQDEVNSYNEKRLIAENKCTMVDFGVKYDTRAIGKAPTKTEGKGHEY